MADPPKLSGREEQQDPDRGRAPQVSAAGHRGRPDILGGVRRIAALLGVLALPRGAAADERHIDWFALDVDLGGGVAWPDREGVFLGRARTGYVRVRGELLSSVVAAAETKDLQDLTLGVGGELVSVRSGLAVHGAVMASTSGTPALELGAGWAGLRLEGQVAFGDRTAFAVVAFARLPFGAIAYKLWGER
jgi:hypothetical protein